MSDEKRPIKQNVVVWIYKSLLTEPENWERGNYTLTHKATGLQIWIANSWFHLCIYRPQEINFSFYWKIKIWRAFKTRWMRLTVYDIKPNSLEGTND